MKKSRIFSWTALLLMACPLLIACGSDDDDNEGGGSSSSLIGYWTTPAVKKWKNHNFCEALYFKNSNTVEVYNDVADARHWDDPSLGNFSVVFGGMSGWYYQDGCNPQYTYVVTDNKVIISNGYTLTISGNKLVRDGSSASNAYTKCK